MGFLNLFNNIVLIFAQNFQLSTKGMMEKLPPSVGIKTIFHISGNNTFRLKDLIKFVMCALFIHFPKFKI